MKRTPTILMTIVLIVAAAGGVSTVAANGGSTSIGDASEPVVAASNHTTPTDNTTNDTTTNSTNDSIAPGAMLTGALGIQKAELDGDLEQRTFGIRVAQAATNDSKADVVGEQLSALRDRLAELEERKAALERARENGSISNDTYKAKLATIAAQTNNVKQMANMSEQEAEGLPADLLESKGINASAIQKLKSQAKNLSGPEVAAVAKQIGGPSVGQSIAGEKAPVDVGPPAQAGPGNETDQNETRGNVSAPTNRSAGNETAGSDRGGPDNETRGNETGDNATERGADRGGNETDGNETRGGMGNGSATALDPAVFQLSSSQGIGSDLGQIAPAWYSLRRAEMTL